MNEPWRRGNPAPLKGKAPAIPASSGLHQLITNLLRGPRPIAHVSDVQYNLTIGQVRKLQDSKITLLMYDDLGSYELVEGPDMRVVKRRI